MINDPEIGRYLVASTGHLSVKERLVLDSIPWAIFPFEYGWWVHVPARTDRDPEEMQKCLPKRLRRLVKWASERGLQFIKLDADGPIYPELEFFDE